jgi:hypothetical protein
MVRGATRSRSLLVSPLVVSLSTPADVLEPVGQLTQQRRAGIPDHPSAASGEFEPAGRVDSLHPQGGPLTADGTVRQPHPPWSEGSLRNWEPHHPQPREKPRLAGSSCRFRSALGVPATYGVLAWWGGPRRFLEVPVILVGPMLGGGATGRSSTVEVAASPPTVRLGSEQAFQLHQAPDPGAVGTEVGLDVRGRLADGGQVDTEQLRAPFQRHRDRPAQVQVVPSPHREILSNACSRSNRELAYRYPGEPHGHFWATNDRIAVDNKDRCRPSICPAQRARSPTAAVVTRGPELKTLRALMHSLQVVCWQSAGNRRRSGGPGTCLCWWA